MGDYLIVAVQDSDCILKYYPEVTVLYTTEQRMELVEALRDVDEIVKNVEFDVFLMEEIKNTVDFSVL